RTPRRMIMRRIQLVFSARFALAAFLIGMAAPTSAQVTASAAKQKQIVLPIKITACTQYLEIADLQQKIQDSKQSILDTLVLARDVEISVAQARLMPQPPDAPGAQTSPELSSAALKNSTEIKLVTTDLAAGAKVIAMLQDAYRRCIVAPQALLTSPTAPAKAVASTPAKAKKRARRARDTEVRAAPQQPRTGHDPGASAIVGGAIGGALGGFAR
ncbi:MAG TPA: hypothetical protein VIV34_01785, partial [Pseudolabrys sp.]